MKFIGNILALRHNENKQKIFFFCVCACDKIVQSNLERKEKIKRSQRMNLIRPLLPRVDISILVRHWIQIVEYFICVDVLISSGRSDK